MDRNENLNVNDVLCSSRISWSFSVSSKTSKGYTSKKKLEHKRFSKGKCFLNSFAGKSGGS